MSSDPAITDSARRRTRSGEERIDRRPTARFPAADVLCTVDPLRVGMPDEEIEAEETAGLAALEALRQVLERVALTGTVRKQFIGQFPNWVASKSNYYTVNAVGQLLWFEHVWNSQHKPGVPMGASGPRKIAEGWDDFDRVLPAGDKSIYALRRDGRLVWYSHKGAFDGEGELTGPLYVGTQTDWTAYADIVAAGNGILSGIMPDGTLYWHKHKGFENEDGSDAWHARTNVGAGWNGFKQVFSADLPARIDVFRLVPRFSAGSHSYPEFRLK